MPQDILVQFEPLIQAGQLLRLRPKVHHHIVTFSLMVDLTGQRLRTPGVDLLNNGTALLHRIFVAADRLLIVRIRERRLDDIKRFVFPFQLLSPRMMQYTKAEESRQRTFRVKLIAGLCGRFTFVFTVAIAPVGSLTP